MMYSLSIVIINYKSKKLTDNCIRSYNNYCNSINTEIIVVNNSPDENLDDLKYENLLIINNEKNLGFAKANNLGIANASGEYTLILNADTIFIEDLILPLIEILSKQNNYAAIGCKLLNEDLSHQNSIVDFDNLKNVFGESFFLYKLFPSNRNWNKHYLNYNLQEETIEVDVVMGAFMLFKTEILKKFIFDESYFFYSEEVDLCKRLKNEGYKVLFTPKYKIIHLGGGVASHQSWFSHKFLTQSKIKYYKKHFSGSKRYLLICIMQFGNFLRFLLNLFSGVFTLNKQSFLKALYFLKRLMVRDSL